MQRAFGQWEIAAHQVSRMSFAGNDKKQHTPFTITSSPSKRPSSADKALINTPRRL